MWLQQLLPLILSALLVNADEACVTYPGEPALTYSDGRFNVPSGDTPSFSVGTTLNVSWTTDFDSSTLWLITGCDFSLPALSLATGITDTFLPWEVSTVSTNASQVYMFRVVNTGGTSSDLLGGGFLSATFHILGGPSPSSSSLATQSSPTASSSSTSASDADASTSSTSSVIPTSTDASFSPSPSAEGDLSQGGKIGVGVGVSVGVIGMIGLGVGLYLWGKSRKVSSIPAQASQEYRAQNYGAVSSAQYYDPYKGPTDQHPQTQHGDHGIMAQVPPSTTEGSIISEMYGGPRSSTYHELQ